jgi:xylose dehydrogenase (NAD/NADP)
MGDMSSTPPVQFGIIGMGRIARNAMVPAIHGASNAQLAATASRDIERARSAEPLRAYGDYIALINDPDVEAVYIATHNGLHESLTIAALENGKHVLCEKSLACDASQCDRMVAAARRCDRILVEAFMYRHHPCYSKAASIIASGRLGELRAVDAGFGFVLADRNDVRYRADWGGGSALDVGCYAVNAGRYGTVSCAFDAGYHNRIVIRGEKGSMTIPKGFSCGGPDVRLEVNSEDASETIRFEPLDVYRLQVENFARAVRGQAPPPLPADDGLHNLRVIDAMFASARTGGGRVET